MILLEGQESERDERPAAVKFTKLYLPPGDYAVGRTPDGNQIVLQEDVSISRNHAMLQVFPVGDSRASSGVATIKGECGLIVVRST